MMLDFHIIGAQKAGSSWLAANLAGHPGIHIPSKEVHYFDVDQNYDKGEEWYAQFFARAEPGQLLGEKTPSLFIERANGRVHPIHQRLLLHNPDIKLLVVLRDPIRRALSALQHHMWKRRLPPRAAIRELLFGRWRERAETWGILEQGLYYRQLSYFWQTFSAGQIKVWIFENDLIQAPQTMLSDAAAFVGADGECPHSGRQQRANRSVQDRRILAANYAVPTLGPAWQLLDRLMPSQKPPELPPDVVAELHAFYRDDITQLERALARDLDAWEQKHKSQMTRRI